MNETQFPNPPEMPPGPTNPEPTFPPDVPGPVPDDPVRPV